MSCLRALSHIPTLGIGHRTPPGKFLPLHIAFWVGVNLRASACLQLTACSDSRCRQQPLTWLEIKEVTDVSLHVACSPLPGWAEA